MRDQNLPKAQNAVLHSTEERSSFWCGNVHVTRVALSTRVTSAQKLEMLKAMVFPWNPSEGFPINPTLRGNTRPLTSSGQLGSGGVRPELAASLPGVRSAHDGLGGIVPSLGGVVREPLGVIREALGGDRKCVKGDEEAAAGVRAASTDSQLQAPSGLLTTCPISWKPEGSFIPNTWSFLSLTSHS